MTERLSRQAREVLKHGTFCLLAAFPAERVHLTPVVFVVDGGRIWLTTSRTSVKARTWKHDPRTAGLVEYDGLAVTFRGTTRSFDLLDPGTWAASALRSAALTRAAARFSVKNARFFAGYARDAHRVPLSWTPPARVFTSVEVEAAALLDIAAGTVVERWGFWPDDDPPGSAPFGAAVRERGPDHGGVPTEVAGAVGVTGESAVGLMGEVPAVLPCRWRAQAGTYLAAVSREHLRLPGVGVRPTVGLTAQRPSAWRAREMRGVLAEGTASVHLPPPGGARRAGAGAGGALVRAGGEPGRDALLRLQPDRVVWWSGWSAGTVPR